MTWLRRILYAVHRRACGLHYHAGRRFTRPGLAVLGAILASATLGADMDQTVAAHVFTVTLALLGVATVGSRCFGGRFSATRQLPRYGTVDQPLVYSVTLRNETDRWQKDVLLLEDLADARPTFADYAARQRAAEKNLRSFSLSRRLSEATRMDFTHAATRATPLPPLPPRGQIQARLELVPRQRGVLRFEGLTVARPEPLGLVRSFVRLPHPQSVCILPRRYPLPDIPLPGREHYQLGGVALASSIGESEEFVSLRDYRPGDPLRHIHWRSWARAGRPIVTEHAAEFFVRHALVLDTFLREPGNNLFEAAVSVAASFACTVRTQESLLDLLFVGPQAFCFTTGRGLAHTEQMLEILASVQPCTANRFAELENLVGRHAPSVSGGICVLLAWDEARQQLVRSLRHVGIPVRVIVLTAAGAARDLAPGPMADRPGDFQVLAIDTLARGLAGL